MITKEQAIEQGFEYSTNDVCAICNITSVRLRQLKNGRTDKRANGSIKYVELATLEQDKDYIYANDGLRIVTMFAESAIAKIHDRLRKNV